MSKQSMPMQLLVASNGTSADLHIMGNITRGSWLFGKTESDTDAKDVAEALADLPDTCSEITVHINSMGGEVSQGVGIYNALKAHKAHVTTICEGFACSIASVIFMAGDDRVMCNASLLMVHNAWMSAGGNASDLRKAADDLDTINELSKRAYMEHATGELTRELLDQLMDEETWILPERAVELGMATEAQGSDEADEPEQSAMRSVMQRLTEPRGELLEAEQQLLSEENLRAIAAAVAQAIAEGDGAQQDEPPEPDPPQSKTFMQRAALLFATD